MLVTPSYKPTSDAAGAAESERGNHVYRAARRHVEGISHGNLANVAASRRTGPAASAGVQAMPKSSSFRKAHLHGTSGSQALDWTV
jgi:hypothetical protein